MVLVNVEKVSDCFLFGVKSQGSSAKESNRLSALLAAVELADLRSLSSYYDDS